jgi:hypothetical protein
MADEPANFLKGESRFLVGNPLPVEAKLAPGDARIGRPAFDRRADDSDSPLAGHA